MEIMYTKFHTFHRLHALNLNADSSAVKLWCYQLYTDTHTHDAIV